MLFIAITIHIIITTTTIIITSSYSGTAGLQAPRGKSETSHHKTKSLWAGGEQGSFAAGAVCATRGHLSHPLHTALHGDLESRLAILLKMNVDQTKD